MTLTVVQSAIAPVASEFDKFDQLLQQAEADKKSRDEEATKAKRIWLEDMENQMKVLQNHIDKAARVTEHVGGEDKLPEQARQMLANFREELAQLEADENLQTFLADKKAREERAAREAQARKERKAKAKAVHQEILEATKNVMAKEGSQMVVITSKDGDNYTGAVVLFHDGVDVIVEQLLGDAKEGISWQDDGRKRQLLLFKGQYIATEGFIGAIDKKWRRHTLHPAIFKYLREAGWVRPSSPDTKKAVVVGRGINTVIHSANSDRSKLGEQKNKDRKQRQAERAAETYELIRGTSPEKAANE